MGQFVSVVAILANGNIATRACGRRCATRRSATCLLFGRAALHRVHDFLGWPTPAPAAGPAELIVGPAATVSFIVGPAGANRSNVPFAEYALAESMWNMAAPAPLSPRRRAQPTVSRRQQSADQSLTLARMRMQIAPDCLAASCQELTFAKASLCYLEQSIKKNSPCVNSGDDYIYWATSVVKPGRTQKNRPRAVCSSLLAAHPLQTAED